MTDSKSITSSLICPRCANTLGQIDLANTEMDCTGCHVVFPIVDGIPVMIDEEKSAFCFADFVGKKSLFFDISSKGRVVSLISKVLPKMGGNNLGTKNFDLLEQMLTSDASDFIPRVLVVGGSIIGDGMDKFVNSAKLEIVEADVSFGPQTKIIFDAHAIPYADCSFDCVVVQAVLEHVIDAHKCVQEIYRVLKPKGIVYAETPFMQQVHGGPYDFVRFTRSGHRRLFRNFEELKSGITAGSGTALAWSYEYFLLSFFGYSKFLRLVVKVFARISGFWIKYLDYLIQWNPRDIDGASGFYFMGRKSGIILVNDKELVRYYR